MRRESFLCRSVDEIIKLERIHYLRFLLFVAEINMKKNVLFAFQRLICIKYSRFKLFIINSSVEASLPCALNAASFYASFHLILLIISFSRSKAQKIITFCVMGNEEKVQIEKRQCT